MSVAKINTIASQLQAGQKMLDLDTANELQKAVGKRYAPEEQQALMALDAGIDKGTISSSGVGRAAFFDLVKSPTQSRFAHGFEEAQDYGAKGAAISSALGAVTGAGVMAVSTAGMGLAAMAPAAGAGALAGLGAGRVVGSLVGFVKGAIED